ncbi:capsular polysaccharide export protein, LipB/KpsS family [Anaeromicropila populeti]|uniref:Capsule polysaccharide biosynthesis protein n=1 Tax=Anaeromicropila populeti TaxID=37658 RepID=A0A1I6HW90_9FIRM|nr:hypothetical protein [Anaeromicropila populeti]SFR58713.1 Capsule polysaccharide biosynthesis protein [Anaeromicropila populeti]
MRIDKYIDESKVFDHFDQAKGKKIYCFGGGTAGEIILRIIGDNYQLAAFLDNDSNKWGSCLGNLEIKNPEILKDENPKEICVFIVSRHELKISEQLEEYGLKKGKSFFCLYSLFERYFRLQKALDTQEEFIAFLNRTPDNVFEKVTKVSDEKIGVVALSNASGLAVWFDIALCLLLKLRGYQVSLIIDYLPGFPEIMTYEGATEDIIEMVEEVIEVLKKKFPELEIIYVDKIKPVELSQNEKEEMKKIAPCTAISQLGHLGFRDRSMDREKLISRNYETGLENMKYIKGFFEKYSFAYLNIFSGITERRSMYSYFADKNGIRVSNYDGAGSEAKNRAIWANDKPCCHQFGITETIKNNMLNDKQKAILLSEANRDFLQRRYGKPKPGTTNCQLVAADNKARHEFDIVIPLNVMFDVAAIGLDEIFVNTEEWLMETLDFILAHTEAKVMVREHPAQEGLKDYNCMGLEDVLKNRFQKNKNFYFAASYEKINTYSVIENCKVVLPYSSTVGVEAALMGKVVITHTKCYYSEFDFVQKAVTKEDYFAKIAAAVKGQIKPASQLEDAYLAYMLVMNNKISCEFNETNNRWLKGSLESLNKTEGMDLIMEVVAKHQPQHYCLILEYLNKLEEV